MPFDRGRQGRDVVGKRFASPQPLNLQDQRSLPYGDRTDHDMGLAVLFLIPGGLVFFRGQIAVGPATRQEEKRR